MRQGEGFKSVILIILGVLSLSFLCGQSIKSSSQQQGGQYDAAAVIKLVMVRVLDQGGHPVSDLSKADFVLFDNGKKQAITEFEIHTMGAAGMEVRTSSGAQNLVEAAEGMNRRLFIYLDIQGSDATGMDNAKHSAVHFIDTKLKPGDEVGIIGFSPTRGFFIQEYLTQDLQKIRRALEKTKDIEVKPSAGFISGAGDDSIPADARLSNRDRTAGITGNEADVVRSTYVLSSGSGAIPVPGSSKNHRRDFVPQMSDLAEALKYIPGNKSLIFFSGRNLGPVYRKLGKEFASASTPVYTINTKNWIRQGLISLSIKKKHIWEDHPLEELALASGGKYFPDIEDTAKIAEEIQALTGNYYVLGYYVPDTWDGKYHEIKIEVKRPGLKILAQDGYFNPKPYSEFTEFEKQLHLFDLVFSEDPSKLNPTELPLDPLLIAENSKINFALLAHLRVDERTGVSPSKTEIYAFLFNEDEEVVLKRRGEMNLTPFDQEDLIPYFTANLPAGEYEGRVAARNMDTGQAASGRISFDVPEKREGGILLSSPILFKPGPSSQIVKLSPKGKDVSLNDIYRYIPKNHTIIVNEIGMDTESILAVLPMTIPDGADAEVNLSVRIHPRQGGETMVLPILYAESQKISNTKEILVMEIGIIDVEPGEYNLEIEALNVETMVGSRILKSILRH